ncbi:hypothetical protein NV379_02020 [Paenibacillus sp. N1-5-1-14]|uniref:hypothetical protein n=1 Tax=Paenibacillus radicibacter TaxID=2972488 RepID=UPI002158BD38|nr:hypothetical protein [Paenibacillus radicibacter]MCR8641422.1 hypothetical protein [Paenibacillus radicibacter]
MKLVSRMFQINTDKDFFDKFIELSERVKGLGYLFQNTSITVTDEEVAEWDWSSCDVLDEIKGLLEEASSRIIRNK